MTTRLLAFCLTWLVLAACNPLAPEALPEPQVPATYSAPLQTAARPGPDRWWLAFADPQLNSLEERLFAGNLDILQAMHRLEQLRALQRQSHAGRWPTLTLNGTANRSQSLSAGGETRTSATSLSLAAAYEIDLWNKLADRDNAAYLQVLASTDSIRTLLLGLSAQLAEQYFLAQEQQAQIDLLRRQQIRSQRLLELVTRRYQAGLTTVASFYQAQRNLASIAGQFPPYETGRAQAEHAMAVLLGQPPGSLTISYAPLPEMPAAVAPGVPADLLTRRPDVAMALHQLAAADSTLAATLAERLPSLNLTATLGKAATTLAGGNASGTIWSLATGLSAPLFDAGRRQAAADQQEAVRAEQLAATQKVLLDAMEEIETSLVAEGNLSRRADFLARQLQANNGYRRSSLQNYRTGLSDSTAWLNSEIDQLGILSQQLSNQRQWLSQRITLVRALGGNWMTEELKQQWTTRVEPQSHESQHP